MFRHLFVLIATMAVLGASVAAARQEELPHPVVTPRGAPLGSISGRVVLPSGHPVDGNIRVTLSTPEDPGLPVFTDSNGNFVFNNLPEGTYTIEAIGDRKLYERVSETVRLIRSARISLTIYLRERDKSTNSAGGVISAAELEQQVPPQAKKEYEKAISALNQGKSEEGIERLKRALIIYPGYLIARNDLGAEYLKLRRFAEAVEQFETAIEINAKAFNPRLNLGIAFLNQKRFSEAIDHLTQAISINSSSPAGHLYLGIAALETDDLPTALREIDTAQSMGGREYSVCHYFRAHVAMKQGQRELAISELKAYLQNAPSGEYASKAKNLLEELIRN